MSLIKCKSCGKEINKKASICPNCGVKLRPIKDTLKIVAIVLGVNLVLIFSIYVFSGGLVNTIEKVKEEAPAKKFYGTWELVNKNDNANEYKLDKTIEIKGINDGYSWYIKDKDYIVASVSTITNSGEQSIACFRLDGNYLIQEDCGDWSIGHYIIKDTELKYKRIK